MTLFDFISPLKTSEVKVTLMNTDDAEIIKFYSEGFAGVEDTILNRSVKKWTIDSQSAIKVVLDDVPGTSESTSEVTSETETTSETPTEP